MDYNIILKRKVFWSMLEYALPVPVESQKLYTALTGKPIEIGDRHNIKLLLDGILYDAYFRNEGFSRKKFTHGDIVLLSYGNDVKNKLKEIFHYSYNKLIKLRQEAEINQKLLGKKGRIKVGELEDQEEYVVLSATNNPDIFALDCFTQAEHDYIGNELEKFDELSFEDSQSFNLVDSGASIQTTNAILKIRHLDRSIGESLKKLYDNRCQMTGEKIGENYGTFAVEAHHIDPFTKSLNNDSKNIIIISPNYHRIIHKTNPVFDRDNMQFIFPNGLKEKVKIDYHLRNDIKL